MNISVIKSPYSDKETPNQGHTEVDHLALCLAEKQVDREKSKRGERPLGVLRGLPSMGWNKQLAH